ncbi:MULTISPECIES: helix-turn-helix transcriptional regulator [Pseudonocardia]|uniref:Helix-turn-helix transcriptional regulator n=1 Tax=Pseudonocardia xishanensis TaxID=630995 RepID=A0ABP8RYL1_9PSEU|nr:helix-turn-helix transcriptional regulator [Pseudonocardia sp. WMMC193]MCF7547193.1 helix-turn-helix domain-containing protein [Pseudonocardia sp. WMMC193]
MSSDDLDPRHRRFGERLKKLRQDAGLSAAALGQGLGWSQSKVSKIENARTGFTSTDIESWLDQCRADDEVREAVLGEAAELGTRVRPWRNADRPDHATQQRVRAVRDVDATEILIFQSEVVPGLLQTPEYTRRLLEVHSLVPPEAIPAAVIARMDRQTVLFDEAKRIEVVITETALRWRPGTIALSRAQLDRIGTLAALPNVEIGVISREQQELARPLHSFVLLEFSDEPAAVQVETLTAEQEVTDPADVALYRDFFTEQREQAVRGTDLTALLAAISDELQASAQTLS